jgi:hypothetical protein
MTQWAPQRASEVPVVSELTYEPYDRTTSTLENFNWEDFVNQQSSNGLPSDHDSSHDR